VTTLENKRKPHRTGKNQDFQESLRGFLMDEVINPADEFYADHRIILGQLDENKKDDE
jgi:hypothetical protein